MDILNDKQEAYCQNSPADYSSLKVLFINCTLKRSPEVSHTDGLVCISKAIMERNGLIVN